MRVQIEKHKEHYEQSVTLINRITNTAYYDVEDREREVPRARVDGILWTSQQTKQAIQDGYMCRCNSCICCEIRQEVIKAERSWR